MRHLPVIAAVVCISAGRALACCGGPPPESPDFISYMQQKARDIRGSQKPGESDRVYQLRLNKTFIGLLADEPWDVLVGLQAESDDYLCSGPCNSANFPNTRLALQAASTLKSQLGSETWNWKIFVVAVVSAVLAFLGTIVGFLALLYSTNPKASAKSMRGRVRRLVIDALILSSPPEPNGTNNSISRFPNGTATTAGYLSKPNPTSHT